VDGSSTFRRQNLPLIFALEVGATGDVSITDGKRRGADDDCLAPDSAGAFLFFRAGSLFFNTFTNDGTSELLLTGVGTADGTADGVLSGRDLPCLAPFFRLAKD